MPIHLDDIDVVPEVAGLKSALIVPCNMCPAVTAAVQEKRPFMQLFKSILKSAPFERRITQLQARLREQGVHTDVFRSNIYHQWFLCMWTARRRKKLQECARQYEAAIVLGCDTANETVRESVRSTGCRVIEGMEVSGFINAKLRFRLPCDICLEDCRIVPISQHKKNETIQG